MYPHGSPAFSRRQLRALLALTFLAWAIQTWTSTFARGEEFAEFADATLARTPISRPVALELRGEATVVGGEIRFAQIARWSDGDADVMSSVGDLVVARFDGKTAVMKLSLDDVRGLLRAAGVNVAPLNFSGPRACTVNRSDTAVEPDTALRQYTDAADENAIEQPERAAERPASPVRPRDESINGVDTVDADGPRSAPAPRAEADAPPVEAAERPHQSLRDRLVSVLAEQLQLPVDVLQVSFSDADDNVLRLSEPLCAFRVEPQKASNVGDVTFIVTVTSADPALPLDAAVAGRRLLIKANARAWQDQVIVARPISGGQVVVDEDLLERRVLVSKLGDVAPATRRLLIGRQAVRDLRTGTVLTEKHVDVATLVRPGQIVTITLARGGVAVTSVARAIDGGSLGQSIRVKSETRNDAFRVQITGPQEASVSGS